MFASGYLSELARLEGKPPVIVKPTDLDSYLDKNRGYQGDSVVWAKIASGINSMGGKLGNVEFVDMAGRSLSSLHFRTGRPGLLRVQKNDGGFHYVLLMGNQGRIHDPGTSAGANILLPRHFAPNRVTWFLPAGLMSAWDMQLALTALKFDPGRIDGLIGAKTLKALAAFQQSQNLPLTGYLDPQTQNKLTEMAGDKIKPKKKA